MRVVITGIEGFAGSHLSDLLLQEKWDIYGIKHPASGYENISHLGDKINVEAIDINEHDQVKEYINRISPDAIVHLAAFSKVGKSWQSKVYTYRVNILASANLMEAAASLENPPRLLMISSAEVYGPVLQDKMPIKEDYILNPINPYAVSKASVEMITKQFTSERSDLRWNIIRPFNHTGPRQTTGFVCSDFARQVALIEMGINEPEIKVGNLEAQRDFSDVRDIVKAYKLLLESDNTDTYQVCSGKPYPINSILELLLEKSSKEIKVTIDPQKLRPVDTPLIVGDNSKISEELGWKPEYSFENTLEDLLNYWRNKIKSES